MIEIMASETEESIKLAQFRRFNIRASAVVSAVVFLAYIVNSSKYSDSDNIGMLFVVPGIAIFYAPFTSLILSFLHTMVVLWNKEEGETGFFYFLYKGMPSLMVILCAIGLLVGIPFLILNHELFIFMITYPFTA